MSKHRFHLILPEQLWFRISALAKQNRRAITQEIILAIEARLEHVDAKEKANEQKD